MAAAKRRMFCFYNRVYFVVRSALHRNFASFGSRFVPHADGFAFLFLSIEELSSEEPENQTRGQYLKEEYSRVKKYFQEQKDQAIMERILEVKDDWEDLLSIRSEIEEKELYVVLR